MCYNIIKEKNKTAERQKDYEVKIMMYKAYTQKDWNAEKFFIEENGEPAIIEADSEAEALELFTDHIYATTLYSEEETTKWLEENPIFIIEI